MYLHIAPSISAAIIASGSAFAQAPPPAAVSSDRLADVPLTTSGNDLLSFYNYSWSSFIALNWPAQKGPGNRGLADRSAFGDTDGPRVWMTWKSRCEIFQPGGVLPSPWASYDGQNPCGPDFVNDAVTLSSFSAFGDFNQAGFGLNNPANPLVAQNHTYVRYEVRVNEPEFNSIVGNKWYIANNLPSAATAVPFNVDSTEIKAAWRILTEIDRPNRGRYYVARNAQVFDVATGKCTRQDVALVGLHIVTKTRERPQWIWSTFEHIDNVPNITEEPTPPPTVRFSFNNREEVQTLIPPPAMRPRPISPINKPVADPTPMQVVRVRKLLNETMDMNRAYWNVPEIKGTVWQNYMLVMTQWPRKVAPEDPTNDGNPFPGNTEDPAGPAVSNTTMETYFQNTSCMTCHGISNKNGRDFVMFVTMDAVVRGIPAPGDLFSAKNSQNSLVDAVNALSSDPMLRSLMEFFEAAKQK